MFSVVTLEHTPADNDGSLSTLNLARADLMGLMDHFGIFAPIVAIHFADGGNVTAEGIAETAAKYPESAVIAIAYGKELAEENDQDEALDRAEFLLTDNNFAVVTKQIGGYEFKSTLLFLNNIGERILKRIHEEERQNGN